MHENIYCILPCRNNKYIISLKEDKKKLDFNFSSFIVGLSGNTKRDGCHVSNALFLEKIFSKLQPLFRNVRRFSMLN